jgi:hypothetical protein
MRIVRAALTPLSLMVDGPAAHGGGQKGMEREVVKLSCTATIADGQLVVAYALANLLDEDILVLDLVPSIEDHKMVIDSQPVHLAQLGDSAARLLQGVAPRPRMRLVQRVVVPFGTLVPKAGRLERTVRIAIPVREQGPYDAIAGATHDHEVLIERLHLTVQYVPRATPRGVEALDLREAVLRIPAKALYRVSLARFTDPLPSAGCELKLPAALPLWRQGEGFAR